MSKEISVLLPGSFFEDGFNNKLDYLAKKNIKNIYLFDHSINPSDEKKSMYSIKKGLSVIHENTNYSFNLGVCVLNINVRKIDALFSEYINPMLEIKNFRLGLGTGDNRYEKNRIKYSNNLDYIINDLINKYTFSIDGNNLFIGGTSQKKIDLIKKYSVGVNQWFGDEKKLISIYENIDKNKPTLGRLSHCQNIQKINENPFTIFEQILVLKDSNIKNFYSQIDMILL